MSSAFTPRASRLRIEVKPKPVMASMSPRTSMVSRSGGSIEVQVDVADVVGLGEDREGLAPGVEHRRAELLAVQVGRGLDAALLQRHHRGRRVVVDHHHRHRLVRRGRVVGVELHQRRQVGEAHVVGARGHARDRAARAVAGVDHHVQPLGLEVALGHRHQEQRRRAFEAPVELELDGGFLRMRRRPGGGQLRRPGPPGRGVG